MLIHFIINVLQGDVASAWRLFVPDISMNKREKNQIIDYIQFDPSSIRNVPLNDNIIVTVGPQISTFTPLTTRWPSHEANHTSVMNGTHTNENGLKFKMKLIVGTSVPLGTFLLVILCVILVSVS